MLVDAKLRYSRIAPRKVRLVADLIRGMKVAKAEETLRFTVNRSARPMMKLLKSAVANAENNFNLKKDNLYIAEIRVDGGPIIKRFRARARGSASPIQKKTSHILIRLKEVEESKETAKKDPSTGSGKEKKKDKIKKVYSEERPKEEATHKETKKQSIEKEQVKEPKKEAKGEKKQIFRRKSI